MMKSSYCVHYCIYAYITMVYSNILYMNMYVYIKCGMQKHVCVYCTRVYKYTVFTL